MELILLLTDVLDNYVCVLSDSWNQRLVRTQFTKGKHNARVLIYISDPTVTMDKCSPGWMHSHSVWMVCKRSQKKRN